MPGTGRSVAVMLTETEKQNLKELGVSEETMKKVTAYQYALVRAIGEIAPEKEGIDVEKIKARLFKGLLEGRNEKS